MSKRALFEVEQFLVGKLGWNIDDVHNEFGCPALVDEDHWQRVKKQALANAPRVKQILYG